MKTIKIFSGEKKCKYAHNQCRKLFIENELIEEEKNRKCQHAWSLYNNLSEKTGKRNEYAREKNGNLSEEEKYKKGQYACERNRNLSKGFNLSRKHKKLFSLKKLSSFRQAWESFSRAR